MKIYDFPQAPNPRRVRIFLAEKGITVPYVLVNIGTAENREPWFVAKNPMGTLPVLEFDDGTCLAESVAICRYFEEQKPEPNLMGRDGRERAFIEMWQRRMEFEVFNMTAQSFRNTTEFFKGRIPQIKEYAEVCKSAALKRLEWLDKELATRPYIAGDRFTIADITALVGVDFGRLTDIRIKPEQTNLQRWYDSVSSRPSAKA
ncbi:MAG TPA: glutathione S-transferase family protein [Candidatus Binataceae bacterium]|nr:glutathione S-transferase family protein [Candidatus Binataceae bacterium]